MSLLLGGSAFLLYSMASKKRSAEAEEPDPTASEDGEEDKTFFQKNVLDYKQMAKEQFQIPQLLLDREKKKHEEYAERNAVDSADLGLAPGELEQMKELDFMYGGKTTAEELEEMEAEDDMKAIDPYLKKKKRYIKP